MNKLTIDLGKATHQNIHLAKGRADTAGVCRGRNMDLFAFDTLDCFLFLCLLLPLLLFMVSFPSKGRGLLEENKHFFISFNIPKIHKREGQGGGEVEGRELSEVKNLISWILIHPSPHFLLGALNWLPLKNQTITTHKLTNPVPLWAIVYNKKTSWEKKDHMLGKRQGITHEQGRAWLGMQSVFHDWKALRSPTHKG